MKNFILLFLLISTLATWQACSSKTDESSQKEASEEEMAKATLVKNNEIAAARELKRVEYAKEKTLKEEQRRQAILDKAKLTPTYKDATGKIVYYKAEIDPSYVGGMNEMRRYLSQNLKYPTDARDKGLEGTVFVDFVIDANGKVREVVASDVIGEDIDLSFKEEAVRVVAAMPGWNAGTQHGKAVDASFSIPITFQID